MSTEPIETEYGKFLIPPQDIGIKHQLMRFGAHQRTDLEMLLSVVHSDDFALDLGAHVGTYTVPLARTARQVVAVEADETRSEILK
ncbi:MAG: hypothetical protein AAGB11_03520 [Pseudomonadota bacterium]